MAQMLLIWNAIIDVVKALIGITQVVVDIASFAHVKLQAILDAIKHETGSQT